MRILGEHRVKCFGMKERVTSFGITSLRSQLYALQPLSGLTTERSLEMGTLLVWIMLNTGTPVPQGLQDSPVLPAEKTPPMAQEQMPPETLAAEKAMAHQYLVDRGIITAAPGRTIVVQRFERPYTVYDGAASGTRYSFRPGRKGRAWGWGNTKP